MLGPGWRKGLQACTAEQGLGRGEGAALGHPWAQEGPAEEPPGHNLATQG